jgi:hypothetical protein
MATPYLRVDSYHLNIGNGDGSIHVLVSQPGRVAHKCVLVDGGSTRTKLDPKTKASSPNPIRAFVTALSSVYAWANGRCQFDTIVLTHWDEDHYGTLIKTIREDARDHGRIPYLKYDANDRPATYFYVPNWFPGPGLNGARPWELKYSHVRGLLEPYGWINTSYTGRGRTTKYAWVAFCILRPPEVGLGLGMRGVLGAELFNNTLVPSTIRLTQIPDIAQLAQANPSAPIGNIPAPSLYCIGVDQTVLGPPAVEVIKESVTMTNRVSIVCVLYWADTGRISHYLGGDADQTTEAAVLNWLTSGDARPARMTSVKISHHGSRSSTPLDFWDEVKPKNVIISLPSRMHIHPCE